MESTLDNREAEAIQEQGDAPESLGDLLAKHEALGREITRLKAAGRAEAVSKIKAMMAEWDVSVVDLAAPIAATAKAKGKSEQGGEKPPVPVKFRHPETGETWTGRGLKPKWLTQALDEGKSLEDFAIQPAEAAA